MHRAVGPPQCAQLPLLLLLREAGSQTPCNALDTQQVTASRSQGAGIWGVSVAAGRVGAGGAPAAGR